MDYGGGILGVALGNPISPKPRNPWIPRAAVWLPRSVGARSSNVACKACLAESGSEVQVEEGRRQGCHNQDTEKGVSLFIDSTCVSIGPSLRCFRDRVNNASLARPVSCPDLSPQFSCLFQQRCSLKSQPLNQQSLRRRRRNRERQLVPCTSMNRILHSPLTTGRIEN